MLFHVLEHAADVSPIARAAPAAVDEDLRRKNSFGGFSFSLNFQTIVQGRQGAKGPATPAILWDMLVPRFGKVVCTVDVSPVKIGRECAQIHKFVGAFRNHLFLSQFWAAARFESGRSRDKAQRKQYSKFGRHSFCK